MNGFSDAKKIEWSEVENTPSVALPATYTQAIIDEENYKPRRRQRRDNLELPWNRIKLIDELARGEKTQEVLAEEYGCTQPAVSMFRSRHMDRIRQVRRDMANEFAGMWIADKRARIEAYQDDAEEIMDETSPEYLRIKHAILKAVAEEMGHLPTRVRVSVGDTTVNYKVNGVDLDKLT